MLSEWETRMEDWGWSGCCCANCIGGGERSARGTRMEDKIERFIGCENANENKWRL